MFKNGGRGAREYPYTALTVEEAKIHCIQSFGKRAKTTKDNRCFTSHTACFSNNGTNRTRSANAGSNSPSEKPQNMIVGEEKDGYRTTETKN